MSTPAPPDFEVLLNPAVRVRSIDDVVLQLRTILLSGQIAANEKLPSERELSRMLGVSRTTIREALRTLEAHGLVEIRLGGTGGAFFREPDPGMVGSALSMLLMFESATESDLTEFRIGFEQDNAALAAERATPEERDELRALAARVRSAPGDANGAAVEWASVERADLDLHELLPVLTHNSVRIAISRGIHDALERSLANVEPQPEDPQVLRDEVLELVRLVIDGDSDGARGAMAEHLHRWRAS